MSKYIAKRIRFRNGERHSVLLVPGGLPVQEVTLFLDRFRRKGLSANTIHYVCMVLALLYRELDKANVDLVNRFTTGQFLTIPELNRLASAAQYRADDLSEETVDKDGPNVINLSRIRLRRQSVETERKSVVVHAQATRLRYMADYLIFLSDYVGSALPLAKQAALKREQTEALTAFRANIPKVSRRAKLGARVGLSKAEEDHLVEVVNPLSPDNPWEQGYVRRRNWLIVVLLLATGMRRGELLGLQIGDLQANLPKLRIIRRADAKEDPRHIQPNAKTNDRELELTPTIMKELWRFINQDRHAIKAARKVPQVFVSDEGEPLSASSIDKMFVQLRARCPGLPVRLTSHVMRHTWNGRFSEQAKALKLTAEVEQQARNAQQGWSEDSDTGLDYTRRVIAEEGQKVALKLQEQLDAKLKQDK